jgi:hypothetical protein
MRRDRGGKGILHYARHFGLLACMAVATAAASRYGSTIGSVASFGIYGALQSATIALTVRAPQPRWRRASFVAIGALLSMSVVTLALAAGRLVVRLPGSAGTAALLAVAAGIGAACHALVVRRLFAARLMPPAVASMALGCAVTSLAVLETGLYRTGGGVWMAASWWFAVTWWFTFSLGLWLHDVDAQVGHNPLR